MNQNCKKQSILAGVCSLMLMSYTPQASALPGLSTPPAVQQAKKVSGIVQDAMGPVIGASIKVKGTNTGVATDFDGKFTLSNVPASGTIEISFVGYKTVDGKFTLSVNPGSTLIVSYIGYITKEVKVGNQTSLKIFLEEDKKLLDEVVVVGYGTMKKSDLSGSSVSVGEKAIKGSVITSLDQSLQGRAAGVTAVSTSGAPGTSLS